MEEGSASLKAWQRVKEVAQAEDRQTSYGSQRSLWRWKGEGSQTAILDLGKEGAKVLKHNGWWKQDGQYSGLFRGDSFDFFLGIFEVKLGYQVQKHLWSDIQSLRWKSVLGRGSRKSLEVHVYDLFLLIIPRPLQTPGLVTVNHLHFLPDFSIFKIQISVYTFFFLVAMSEYTENRHTQMHGFPTSHSRPLPYTQSSSSQPVGHKGGQSSLLTGLPSTMVKHGYLHYDPWQQQNYNYEIATR